MTHIITKYVASYILLCYAVHSCLATDRCFVSSRFRRLQSHDLSKAPLGENASSKLAVQDIRCGPLLEKEVPLALVYQSI